MLVDMHDLTKPISREGPTLFFINLKPMAFCSRRAVWLPKKHSASREWAPVQIRRCSRADEGLTASIVDAVRHKPLYLHLDRSRAASFCY
jgi:hypothetical protein